MKKFIKGFIKSKEKEYNFCNPHRGYRFQISRNKSNNICQNYNRQRYKSYQFDAFDINQNNSSNSKNGYTTNDIKEVDNHCQEPQALSHSHSTIMSHSGVINEALTPREKTYFHHVSSELSDCLSFLNHSASSEKKIKNNIKSKSKVENNSAKGNTYVINIENSRNFLIGYQKTVNSMNDMVNPRIALNEVEFKELLNSQDSLTEEVMKIIAFNFDGHWKNFAKNLELNEESVEELETRFENPTFIVYEILQRFIEKCPNVTLGYIASILRENYQLKVLQKLLKIQCS